jgi:hypothetical protein
VTLSRVVKRSIVRTDYFSLPGTTPLGDGAVELDVDPMLSGGIASPFPVSAKVEIVPTFRVQAISRSDGGTYDGVGAYLYQFGTTVRFKW